jgi:hypothetical protein
VTVFWDAEEAAAYLTYLRRDVRPVAASAKRRG